MAYGIVSPVYPQDLASQSQNRGDQWRRRESNPRKASPVSDPCGNCGLPRWACGCYPPDPWPEPWPCAYVLRTSSTSGRHVQHDEADFKAVVAAKELGG